MAGITRSFIPPLDELPEQLHETATAATKAIRDHESARDALNVASHAHKQAPKADAELLRAAVAEGKGDPGTPTTDSAKKALDKADRQAQITKIANDQAQGRYLEQMREHRDAVALHNQPAITEAIEAYRAAEEAHQQAARHLRAKAMWPQLLDTLDKHGDLPGHGGNSSSDPLHPDELRYITESTDAMTTPLPPEQVRLRRDTDGHTMSSPPSKAPEWLAKGYSYVNPDDEHWATVEPKHIQPIRR